MQVPRQLETWLQIYNSLYTATSKTLNKHVGIWLHSIQAKKDVLIVSNVANIIVTNILALFSWLLSHMFSCKIKPFSAKRKKKNLVNLKVLASNFISLACNKSWRNHINDSSSKNTNLTKRPNLWGPAVVCCCASPALRASVHAN